MRNLCAAFLAAALVTTSAFAASSDKSPLAPGKPAGVKQAQDFNQNIMLIVGGTALVGMILALSSGAGGGGTAGANNPNGMLNNFPATTST